MNWHEFHGCLTGDCPHEKESDCSEAIKAHWKESFYEALSFLKQTHPAYCSMNCPSEFNIQTSDDMRHLPSCEKIRTFLRE